MSEIDIAYNKMLENIETSIFDHKRFLELFSKCTRVNTLKAFKRLQNASKQVQNEFMDDILLRRQRARVNKVLSKVK